MEKKLFRNYIFLISYFLLLAFILINYKSAFSFIKAFFSVISPLILGLFIAFLLNGPYAFLNKKFSKLFNKLKFRKKKAIIKFISIFLTYISVLLVIGLFSYILIPQVVKSVYALIEDLPQYQASLISFLDDFTNKITLKEEIKEILRQTWFDLVSKFTLFLSGLLPYITTFLSGFASNVISFVIGFIFSIYLLIEKEHLKCQIKKATCFFFSPNYCRKINKIGVVIGDTFGDFVSGQLSESLIMGSLCFVGMTVFGFSYSLLISIVIGFTNIIPFVGPWIGTIPSALILLLTSPLDALYFIIFILVLQQLDSNIIYPKVVGSSMGLSPLWVLFAITLGGRAFGVVGMLAAVPLMSIIQKLLRDKINNS